VITAFSRKDVNNKVYVQHKIREHGHRLAALVVDAQAVICVSGRAKFMPKSVEKAFTEVIQTKLQTSQPADPDLGSKYVAKMRREGRYQQEVW
jgi:sulfite reductase alpha subunit-like flavoprotein